MARRGLFAELHHQAQVADKRRRQQQAAAQRAHAAALREAERARRASEQAQQAAGRASAAERARMDKEAARLHVESRMAEVAARNTALAGTLEEIDGLLAATLAVDDYVDLQALMVTVEHPPFTPGNLAVPTPEVPPLVYPPEPVYQEPPPPGGLFGAKKKHEQAVQRARAEFEAARQQWHDHALRMHAEHVAAQQKREQTEAARVMRLAEAKQRYEQECSQRDADAAAHNAELTELINGLAFDVEAAIAQYVDIVLSNSVYPDAFPVTHDGHFDLATRELTLTATVPPPSAMPTVKEYRYVKAKDEITSSTLVDERTEGPLRQRRVPSRGPQPARGVRSRPQRQDPLHRADGRHAGRVAGDGDRGNHSVGRGGRGPAHVRRVRSGQRRPASDSRASGRRPIEGAVRSLAGRHLTRRATARQIACGSTRRRAGRHRHRAGRRHRAGTPTRHGRRHRTAGSFGCPTNSTPIPVRQKRRLAPR